MEKQDQAFRIEGGKFLLNGEEFKLYSGAIHYFRTVPEDWEDRLRKLKAAGFNTVETYVCWNLHEPKPGVFDFSGMMDIVRFLQIAQDLGIWAIVRPGPYICSEWDLGGLPPWLLADPSMRLRCAYAPYLERVRIFYEKLLPLLAPMQITQGGNVLMVQVENEYGSYGNDKEYLRYVDQLLKDNGIDVPTFTSDGGWENMLTGGNVPGALATANFGSKAKKNFDVLRKYEPQGPWVCMEFWNGWFDHWGGDHHARDSKEVVQAMNEIFDDGGYINFYMFHGGTNFGYTAGANHYGKYTPTVTSYDDDALLTEWGGYTPKYHAVRKALFARQGIPEAQWPELPAEAPLQSIGAVKLTEQAMLFDNLDVLSQPQQSVMPESMEYYGQNYGLILYRNQLEAPQDNCELLIDGLADRAGVFVDGGLKGRLDRNDAYGTKVQLGKLPKGGQIDVLVEAMGRVNYGPELHDRKGARQIRIDNQLLSHFEVFPLPLDDLSGLRFASAKDTKKSKNPVFMRGTFNTSSNADCFVHLDGLVKGLVFVNGNNLGRYWKIGPQKSLYLPGAWLKTDAPNEIIVLELEGGSAAQVKITDVHNIGKRKK